jgi:hypothetical protein
VVQRRINDFFIPVAENGNAGGNSPAGTTPEVEMTDNCLTLVLKILAILDLIIKAVVIILRH